MYKEVLQTAAWTCKQQEQLSARKYWTKTTIYSLQFTKYNRELLAENAKDILRWAIKIHFV